jgi:hypothetical protein
MRTSLLKIRIASLLGSASLFLGNSVSAQLVSDPVAALAQAGQLLAADVQFTADYADGDTKITWNVPAEGGIAYYEIYRASGDQVLTRICTFKSVQSSGAAAYSFYDRGSAQPGTEYRLVVISSQGGRVLLPRTTSLVSR